MVIYLINYRMLCEKIMSLLHYNSELYCSKEKENCLLRENY